MFGSNGSLKGKRTASFRMPREPRQKTARVFSVAFLVAWAFLQFQPGSDLKWQSRNLLLAMSGFANVIAGNRYVRFYEKGLSVPKHSGAVFLTHNQILGLKMEGGSFTVTGPDASWGGPYSGGTFQIRDEDLPKFRDVLSRFTHQPA